jgi:hypothetical protein
MLLNEHTSIPFLCILEFVATYQLLISDDIMKRFIKPIADYIFQTYLYTMLSGYENDLKKELLYVDIRHIFISMRAEIMNK